jgi:hypothetical protein
MHIRESYTAEQMAAFEKEIDGMTQREMAWAQRFHESGHPFFRCDLSLNERFQKRFKELGGMTPEISKSIGWGT